MYQTRHRINIYYISFLYFTSYKKFHQVPISPSQLLVYDFKSTQFIDFHLGYVWLSRENEKREISEKEYEKRERSEKYSRFNVLFGLKER
jgi:hypothetical protein